MIFELLALMFTAVFAGAAIYITFVEHPARLACGPAVALTQWRPSYKRATVMQASLAVLGLVSAVAAYAQGRSSAVLVGGLLLGAVVPFTLLAIRPTNKLLEDHVRDSGSGETVALLARWGRLHAVRTFLSAAALAVLVGHVFGYL